MIDFLKIEALIKSSDEVYITAHKNIDLDALGSILGIYYVTNSLGKNAYIVIDDEEVTNEVKRALATIKKVVVPIKCSDIEKFSSKSLLVVTDTCENKRVQNEKLLDIKNKIVIDHHIETSDGIDDCAYKYVDIFSSSATEIVLDLVNELNIYIPAEMATIMLAGIYIDTNGFLLKTTEKTHVYTSMLYKFGADNKEAQYLLKQNFNEFKRRQKLTLATEFYNEFAVTSSDNKYSSTELAKACDVLLTFDNIEAAFVIARIDEDVVGISARSLGNIDVEDIMSNFNGGGHKTAAATRVSGKTVEEVKNELLEFLGGVR